MYITGKFIESFVEDVRNLTEYCKVGYSWIRVSVTPKPNGLEVNIYGDNGYTIRDADNLAHRFMDRWDSHSDIPNKYKGYLIEDTSKRDVGYSGEGEYDVDYGMDIRLIYNFDRKIDKSKEGSAKKFFLVKGQLFNYLKKITNHDIIVIEDKGTYCSIGKFFEYNYKSQLIRLTDRVNPFLEEVEELSMLVTNMLVCLGNLGAPIHSVRIDRYIPYYTDFVYFYSIGDECILWNDIRRGQFKYLFEDIEIE